MHTSRLGKFVIVLAGAIGFLCVGGGNAHADTVSINNVSVTNNSSSSQTTSGDSAAVISQSSTQVDTSSAHTPSKDSETGVASKSDSAAPPQLSAEAVKNSDATSDVTSKDETTVVAANSSNPLATPAGNELLITSPESASQAAAYYPPKQIQPVILASQNSPAETADDQSGAPKPTQPTLPQAAFELVSTAGAPSPLAKFLGGLSGLHGSYQVGLMAFLVLILALLFQVVTSAFLSQLQASGYSTAPRGSTSLLNFAFPVGESHLSNKLNRDSLFSTPQRLLGGWWYQGGRI